MGTAARTMDFATNQKRYVDVAVDEQDMFRAAEPEVKYKELDEDLRRAIPIEDVRDSIISYIRKKHASKV
jgi:hypothetical protein